MQNKKHAAEEIYFKLASTSNRQQLCNSCNQVVTRMSHPSYNLVTTVAQLHARLYNINESKEMKNASHGLNPGRHNWCHLFHYKYKSIYC